MASKSDSPTKKCTHSLCGKPLRARGYCSTHYATFMRGTLNSPLSLGEKVSLTKRRIKKARTDAKIGAAVPKGRNHWNWKGGISTERKIAYATSEYKNWRRGVFERDNFTCQICGQYNGQLHVDHIKPWSKFPELRYELFNGRTLCRSCHYFVTVKREMPEGSRWGIRVKTYGV